jgi:hypothetical protein
MKKIKAFIVLFTFCSLSFGQINILKEEQLLVDEDADIMLYSMESKGFLLKQEFESEKSSRDRTWRFTLYNLDLSQQWTKDITLEKSCRLTAVNIDKATVDLIYIIKNNASVNSQDLTIATISPEGEAKTKDFVLKNASGIGGYTFIDGLGYFSATKGNSGILSGNEQDIAYIIDFENLSITKKDFGFPISAEISNLFSDGKIIYFYANWSQNNTQRDSIISVENGELAYKFPVKLAKETAIDNIHLIKADSTHRFFMGETKKWVSGSRSFSESYDYQFFIAKIEKDSISPIQNVEKKYTSEFENKRDVRILHGGGGNFNNKLSENKCKISSCFRVNDKNYVVFDKYQTKRTSMKKDREPEVLFFTNTIVWCFNDNGEIEWSRNIEYDIITPFSNPVTSARLNANNTISIFGQFEDEVAVITLAMDGSMIGDPDPFKVKSEIDMDDYLVKNSITPLSENKYVVWGLENESYEQAQKRLKKKDYNIKLNLKIVEIK